MQTSLWKWNRLDWVEAKKARLAGEGVTFQLYESELTLALLDFVSREFPGDWVRVVREAMGHILQGEPANRLICAVEGGRVLGFAHHIQERFGPIGVASSQRGRGLGQVLMWETLHAQRAQGIRASWFLWSDDSTAARLYNSAGFVEVRRFALLKKSLEEKGTTT
ncbi:MAG: GNAT family N-acetyltransferase [Armatimonadetes bacterium]|nr:GNAT family N-acetyltransferase [Armatimonadota bacterium]